MLSTERKDELKKMAHEKALEGRKIFGEWLDALSIDEKTFLIASALERSSIVIITDNTDASINPPGKYWEN